MMLFVPPERQKSIKEKLTGLLHVPCKFEFGGSQIVFFDPETDYSSEEQERAGNPAPQFREMPGESGPA